MKFIEYLKEQKITLQDLATACSIPYATLHNNIERPQTLKVVNLRKISSYLDIPMEQLFSMMEDKTESLLQVFLEQKRNNLSGKYLSLSL